MYLIFSLVYDDLCKHINSNTQHDTVFVVKDKNNAPEFNVVNYTAVELNQYITEPVHALFTYYDKNIMTTFTKVKSKTLIINNVFIDISVFNYFDLLLPVNSNIYFKFYDHLKIMPPLINPDSTNLLVYNSNTELENINTDYSNIYVVRTDDIKFDNITKLHAIFTNVTVNKIFDFIDRALTMVDPKLIELDYDHLDKPVMMNKNINYIITNKSSQLYNKKSLLTNFVIHNYFFGNYIVLYKSYGLSDNDLTMMAIFNEPKEITINTLLQNINYKCDVYVSSNTYEYNMSSIIKQYYVYGLNNIHMLYYPLNLEVKYGKLYNSFIRDGRNMVDNNKYNKNKAIKCISFNLGLNKLQLDEKNIISFINNHNDLFNIPKCLFISKTLSGYGGNQLTGKQIYQLLLLNYDINVWCDHKKGTILADYIHIGDILKINGYKDIINHINGTNYVLIVNNKLNEYFKIIDKIRTKAIILSHNSMDPINSLIIKHKHNISHCLTVNDIHGTLMRKELQIPCCKYYNYCDKMDKIHARTRFKKRIVFIGRISKEKNVNLLLDAWRALRPAGPAMKDLELIILGDGSDIRQDISGVKYYGSVNQNMIRLVLSNSDYLILPSNTEGLPFAILEAMSMGLPCIGSNINGINELIDNDCGFLFELNGYDSCKNNIDNWDVIESVKKHYDINVKNICNIIAKAYSITINEWNRLSTNSYNFIENTYTKQQAIHNNLNLFEMISKQRSHNTKLKVFINFNNIDQSYGGGNQYTSHLVRYLKNRGVAITYELESDIDIYLMIDIRNGRYKKYGIDEVYVHRNKVGYGYIIYRVNDCDSTRSAGILEKSILDSRMKIDHYIFNSSFIKDHYLNKYNELRGIKHNVIYNTTNESIFYPLKTKTLGNRIRIVTHHWSDNINKGYDIYNKLWNYCRSNERYEFVFIGRKFNDDYKDSNVRVIGPYSNMELSNALRECDIYVSASILDACPMHIVEGISCGLPILYINYAGGGKSLCEISGDKIGEPFNDFDDLLLKLEMIVSNYDVYVENINKNLFYYNSNKCYEDTYNLMLKVIS